MRRATGWQQASFAAPVAITANTTYVVSYYAPVGQYAADASNFATQGVDNAPLHALANGVDGANGVYRYGDRRRLPRQHLPVHQLLGRRRLQHLRDGHHATDCHRQQPRGKRHRRAGDHAPSPPRSASPSRPAPFTLALDRRRHRGAPARCATTRRAARDLHPDRRAGRSTDLHRHGHRRHGPRRQHDGAVHLDRSPPARRSGCPCTIWPNTATPGTGRRQRQLGRRARREVPRVARPDTSPGSGSTREPATPAPTSARCGPTPAPGWPPSPSPARPRPAGSRRNFAVPGAGHRQHDLRRLLPHRHRLLLGELTGCFASAASTAARCTALANGTDGGQRRLPLRRRAASRPTPTSPRNYWVDVVFDTDGGGHHRADRDRAERRRRTRAGVAVDHGRHRHLQRARRPPASVTMTAQRARRALVAGTRRLRRAPPPPRRSRRPRRWRTRRPTRRPSAAPKDAAGNAMAADQLVVHDRGAATAAADQGPGGPIAGDQLGAEPASSRRYYAEILRTEGLNEFATADCRTRRRPPCSASTTWWCSGQMSADRGAGHMFTTG